MIAPNGDIRCDICGLVMVIMCDMDITADSRDGAPGAYYNTHLDVCDKCLPNLLAMLEVAIIKTSQLMVTVNGELEPKHFDAECVRYRGEV